MKTVKIDKDYIDNVIMPRLQEKIAWWNARYPQLQFDEFGRAKIAQLPALTVDVMSTEMRYYDMTSVYKECFNAVLSENNYLICGYDNQYYANIGNTGWLSMSDLVSNSFRLKDRDTNKKLNVKASRIFAQAHTKWLDKMPTYKLIIGEIKNLRKQGKTFADCYDLQALTNDKEYFEKGNISILYEKVLNANQGSKDLMISINPLDKLASSGGSGTGDNPTGFSSCWSTRMRKYNDYIEVESYGGYSNVEGQIALGMIMNCGMIYMPNGTTLDIPDTPYSLVGYKERSHVWLDEDGIWIEKMYPCKDENRKQEIMNGIREAGFSIIEFETTNESDYDDYCDYDYRKFQIQDTEYLEKYCQIVDRYDEQHVFLDRVLISRKNDYTLYAMPKDRCSYSYENGDYEPNECENYIVCEECGCRIDADDAVYVDGHYLCNDCLTDNYTQCDRCGEWHRQDDMHELDDNYYCNYCYDEITFECEDCGEVHLRENRHRVRLADGTMGNVCEDCFEKYIICNECGRHHHPDISTEIEGSNICSRCRDRYFMQCADCGEWHHNTEMYNVGDVFDPTHVCEHCHEDRARQTQAV